MNSGMKTAFTSRSLNATELKNNIAARSDDKVGSWTRQQYADLAAQPDFPEAPGWRIIIIPMKPKTKTAGGIELPSDLQWANEVLADIGYVAKVGPVAFQDPRFLDSGAWAKEGQWVNYVRMSGKDVIYRSPDGAEHRLHLCNDKDVLMVIPNPNAMKVYT